VFGSRRNAFAVNRTVGSGAGRANCFFFSSRLADVALRLGPYMSISSQKDICTRTQEVHQSRQIKINQKNTRPTTTTTRKSPSQICVSSRENSKPDKKTGQGPNKQQPQQRFAKGHSGFTTVPLHKSLQNELSTTTFRET
jgi:SLT domain-containing protein